MPDERRRTRISTYVSRHLRHQPQRIGLTLDPHGWVAVDDLLRAAATHGFPFSRAELEDVVTWNDKRRFVIDDDRIRANQGHSVEVDLELSTLPPPSTLWHGTVARFLPAIRERGLLPMNRHHVHLSPDRETAERVGARRGRPVAITVDSGRMHTAGYEFFRSANGVWLVDRVPPEFLGIPEDADRRGHAPGDNR